MPEVQTAPSTETHPRQLRLVCRQIRNRYESAGAALIAWTSKGGCLWGEPMQMGPDRWHVYGAHRRRWRPVNVEFTSGYIFITWPDGIRVKAGCTRFAAPAAPQAAELHQATSLVRIQ